MSKNLRFISGETALSRAIEITDIVPLPYTSRLVIGENRQLNTQLSAPSDIAVHSSVLVHRAHPNTQITVVGEDAHEDLPSTTELTVDRLTGEEMAVDRGSINPIDEMRGQKLNDTYKQFGAVAADLVLRQQSVLPLFVLFEQHVKRGMLAARGAAIQEAYFVSVQEVLRASGVGIYDEMLTTMEGLRISELVKRIIGREKGTLLTGLSDIGIIGPCYLDIIPKADGYKLEEGFARTKKRRLLKEVRGEPALATQ